MVFEYFGKLYKLVRGVGFKPAMKRSYNKTRTMIWIFSQSIRWNHISPASEISDERLGLVTFRCNVCGKINETKIAGLRREESSCNGCGSTVRTRAVVSALSVILFKRSLCIPDFPVRPDIRGIGMSDWEGYALPLSKKLSYRNTFYHKEPRLDITVPGPELEGTLDFVISSDVFEHIAPPVSIAFENVRRLLKPGGAFIFTVPYTKEGATIEHFPDLHEYRIVKGDHGYVLKNRAKDGREQIFDNLIFHGGPGATLEMRVFSESSLLEECRNAGFVRTVILKEHCFEHGIYWHHDISLPMVAKVRKI